MQRYGLATLVTSLLAILLGGTAFFRHVEGWSWLDSWFFTVVTLSTVGYGNLVPVTAIGKIGTTVLIFVGLGVFALTIQQLTAYTIHKRDRRSAWLDPELWERTDDEEAPVESDETQELDRGPRP